jgi:hypothetical protein
MVLHSFSPANIRLKQNMNNGVKNWPADIFRFFDEERVAAVQVGGSVKLQVVWRRQNFLRLSNPHSGKLS